MTNKFKLQLPDNGFGYPCNICAHRYKDAADCMDCTGYSGPFDFYEYDLRAAMESCETHLVEKKVEDPS